MHKTIVPRPPLMETLGDVLSDPMAQRELKTWAWLGIASMAISGIFALLLAVSRIPGIETVIPGIAQHFHRYLVVHVDFSFVVFYLCIFAAMAQLATYAISTGTPKMAAAGNIAIRGMVVAFVFLFFPALSGQGEPVMSNYVPVITAPMFYMALMVLGVSVGVVALRLLFNYIARGSNTERRMDIFSLASIAAAFFYLIAFAYIMVSWSNLAGLAVDHLFNEQLFWAGGHVLQFVNTALLIGAWYAVGNAVFNRTPMCPVVPTLAIAILALGALASVWLMTSYDMFSSTQFSGFTWLQYVFAPATLLVAVFLFKSIWRARVRDGHLPWNNPAFLCLVLSPLVFGLGGVFGLFVDGLDTRTPGHYHAIIAGLTLAFMGLYYGVILPLTGREMPRGKMAFAPIWLFGIGQSIASCGLFIAGGHGTARKVAGAAQELSSFWAKFGMGLNGGGGLLAIIGGALFVWVVAKSLLGKKTIASAEN